jgi:hypothetical protein
MENSSDIRGWSKEIGDRRQKKGEGSTVHVFAMK